ncbi:hypothetical protein XENTR_v10020086 [Xenopus tropicalis]|nr:hypothetical protein XENTR_v10020086 [Xenopus tropicalis]
MNGVSICCIRATARIYMLGEKSQPARNGIRSLIKRYHRGTVPIKNGVFRGWKDTRRNLCQKAEKKNMNIPNPLMTGKTYEANKYREKEQFITKLRNVVHRNISTLG